MTTDATPLPGGAEGPADARGPTAPYMSFLGFRNLLDRFGSEGLPQLFDRSFFGEVSGSLVAQTRGTLKFFDLIDEDRRPTDLLRAVAASDSEKRIEILRELTQKKYSSVVALGVDATQGQLVESFRQTGLSGESITKAITFYLGLAEYTGLPVSPFFKKAFVRPPSGNGSSPRRSSARKKKIPTPQPPVQPIISERHQTNTIEEKKTAYIDLLMKLAEQSAQKGEIQSDLLDRLERALGYDSLSTTKGE